MRADTRVRPYNYQGKYKLKLKVKNRSYELNKTYGTIKITEVRIKQNPKVENRSYELR